MFEERIIFGQINENTSPDYVVWEAKDGNWRYPHSRGGQADAAKRFFPDTAFGVVTTLYDYGDLDLDRFRDVEEKFIRFFAIHGDPLNYPGRTAKTVEDLPLERKDDLILPPLDAID